MIILNYLLAISLVILSVVKTADLFIQSDKALGKTQSQFIEHTKSLLKNKKGNISLTAAILTALLSLLLLFYITKMKIEYREALYRKDSYLCLRFINEQTKNYIAEMAIFNWSLRTAFAIQSSIIATAQAAEVFKGLTIARNIRHFYYLAKLSKNKFCHLPETAFYLKNTPFKIKSNLGLLTNIDETTIMRQKKWTYIYYRNPAGIRLKKSFCLKSEFQMEDVFIPKTSYSSSEIQVKDLSSLKCFSGLWSSPSS